MHTSRAVLGSPHALSPSLSQTFFNTYTILVASILMSSTHLTQAQNTDGYHSQVEIFSKRIDEVLQKAFTEESQEKEISGPDITKMFEGFTPRLTLDRAKNTYCIGYGTDIGKKMKQFPYGDNASDIAEHMRSIGLSDQKIQSILQGNERIDDGLAQKLFNLRYFKRKDRLTVQYETLFEKKFADLPAVVQMATIDFSYNICGEGGIFPSPGFPGFPEACKALKKEDWADFAHEISNSDYTDQVGPRRAGYWIEKFVELSGDPLHTMTRDVQEEVKDFKHVQKEIEMKIAHIMRQKRRNAG